MDATGDNESIKTIESMTERDIRIKYSAQKMDYGDMFGRDREDPDPAGTFRRGADPRADPTRTAWCSTRFVPFRPPVRADYNLPPQENELLKLLVEGHHKKTAAHEMGISINTVSFHLKNIYGKLQVHSKSEAVAKALRERGRPLARRPPPVSSTRRDAVEVRIRRRGHFANRAGAG